MAKKKKLNKRAVTILILFGVIVVALTAALMVNSLIPKDPVTAAARGDEEFNNGNMAEAFKHYGTAVRYGKGNAEYLFKLARVKLEMLKTSPGTNTEKAELFQSAKRDLINAARMDDRYAEPQRMLSDIAWSMAVIGRNWGEYIREATKLLKIAPNDHQTYLKRAVAQREEMIRVSPHEFDPQRVEEILADFNKAIELKSDETRYWLEKVAFLQRVNHHEEVQRTFEEAIDRNPDNTSLRTSFAVHFRMKGKNEDAIKQINEAIRRDPNSTIGYVARAQHYVALNDLTTAMKSLDEALTHNDSDSAVYREMAHILVRQNQRPKACDALRMGVATVATKLQQADLAQPARTRLEEAKWNLHYVLANVLLDSLEMRTSDVDEANVLKESHVQLEEIRHLAPNSIQCAKIGGLIAYHEGQLTEAVKLLEKGLRLPDSTIEVQSANTLIGAYMRLGQLSKAQGVLEEMRKIPSHDRNPSTLLALAEIMMMTRDYAGAKSRVNEALNVDSTLQGALTLRSVLDVLSGDTPTLMGGGVPNAVEMNMLLERVVQLWTENQNERALQLLEDLHRRAPGHTGVITRLLDIYFAFERRERIAMLTEELKGDEKGAKWLAAEIAIRSEKDPNKRFDLLVARAKDDTADPLQQALAVANAAAMMRREKEYGEAMKKAIDIDANNVDVIERMFGYGLRKKDWEQAKEWAGRAATANADGLDGRMYSTRLAMLKGDYPKAIEILQEILQKRPESKVAHTMLADCYRYTNELEKASKEYTFVLDLDPVFPNAVIGMAVLSEMEKDLTKHRHWTEKAWQLPEGQANPYIKGEILRFRRAVATPDQLPNLIAQSERYVAENPEDLESVLALGLMYEQVRDFKKAENTFRYVYKHSANKINGIRPLAEFLVRSARNSDLISVLGELDKEEADKVAVQIVMGDYLRSYSPEIAAKAYQKAIDLDPNDRRGRESMARFLERQRKWADAAAQYGKYLEIAPADRGAQRSQVRCFVEGRNFAAAAEAIQRMLVREPADADTLWLQGTLNMRQRKYAEAMQSYNQAINANASHVSSLLARANLYLVQGETEKATADLQSVRKISNTDPTVTMEYAEACQQLGSFSDAEVAYRDVLSRYKEYPVAHRALAALYLDRSNWSSLESQLTVSRGVFPSDPAFSLIEFQMWKARKDEDKDLSKARQAIETAVKLSAGAPEVVQTYLLWLSETKQYQAALAAADQRIGTTALAPVAMAVKARALAGLGKTSDADKLFVEALKLNITSQQLGLIGSQISDAYTAKKAAAKLEGWIGEVRPKDPQYNVLLGVIYNEAGDWAKSVEILKGARDALATPEQKASVTLTMANAYYRAKQYPEAETAWLDVLKVTPDEMQALNNLAYLYANHLQQPEKALPYARSAIEQMPGNANVVDTYGWVLAKLNRTPEATEILKRAATLGGRQPVFYYHLGYVYEQAKQYAEALNRYELGLRAADAAQDGEMQKTLREAADSCRAKMARENEK